jgi:hypothetical protein
MAMALVNSLGDGFHSDGCPGDSFGDGCWCFLFFVPSPKQRTV